MSSIGGRPSDLRVRQRTPVSARARSPQLPAGLEQYLRTAEAALTEPFEGITTDGLPVPGLFSISKTGVSVQPLLQAALAFLAALNVEQKGRAFFPIDSDAWRRWSNIHPFLMRHGVSLDELSPEPRNLALTLLREGLSLDGFRTARDVMRLNEFIGQVTGSHTEYGEWLYWLSVMGTPSAHEPWGWQLDGHHLIVNCFVLGDQIVMTPMFMGSEPVAAETGPYAGTRVFQAEEQGGLALMRALTPTQQAAAIRSPTLPTEAFTAAFRDNFEMKYEGLPFGALSSAQQHLALAVLETYVGRLRPGHADVRMDEVKSHLAATHFAWMGGFDEQSAFYYRFHSPVILIEFDHQRGIALDNDQPSRTHIHTVVRTPNGNDYGRDLLRQHHQQFDHTSPGHAHR
jgi:Protein of unknown function (DUF3500)